MGLWIALILCIALSAFFSATETAFSACNKVKLKTIEGPRKARALLTLELLEQYRSFQIFLVPASRTKGFGTRALYRQVMKQARKEIAICNFDNNIFLSIYCLSCYYWPACTYKYHMNCTYCRNRKCEKRQSGKQVCCDLECFRHKHKA